MAAQRALRRAPLEGARLFFALVPAPEVCASVAELALAVAAQAGGRPIPASNVHLTLAFLGSVAREGIDPLLAIGSQVPHRAFALKLCVVSSFHHAGVAWLGPDDTPAELAKLHAALASALRIQGFEPDHDRFRPHVTLVRKCTKPPQRHEVAAIAWNVERLALMASTQVEGGVRYDELRGWPLGE